MSIENVPLTGGWIDRDADTRSSAKALALAWNEPAARVLRLRGATVPVRRGTPRDPDLGRVTEASDGATRLVFVSTSHVDAVPHARMYLGRHEGNPVFAVSQPIDTETDSTESWEHPFTVGIELEPAERELVTVASALIRWHEAAAFSPRDGSETEISDGGWSRRDAHGGELFPRTDPAVIVLIEHDGRVLLGSNVLWETGRFSLLAGFVEAGESLEAAVAREVYEESGVRVSNIRYLASQPWPFPRSLMVGFCANLAPGQNPADLAPDTAEISELRWFTRDEVLNRPEGIRLPGDLSIAGALLKAWAERRLGTEE